MALADTRAHEMYIYQRLQEISKKISPAPPNQFQPSATSPRHSSSKLIGSPSRSGLQVEEVQELSSLVAVLQENLRNVQNDHIQVLLRAEADAQHRASLEEALQLMERELEDSQVELREGRELIKSLQFELQHLQGRQEQRERLLADFDEEKESYLGKIQQLQSRLKESEEALRESDKMRNSTLTQMRQQISQFQIDLEFATSHISLLSSQKTQAENELESAKSRGNSMREEIESLNISFNSVVQNLQNTTSLLNKKAQAEAQLTNRVEELEEQLKSAIITLQRRDLTSKEVEISTQEALSRYAACERELEEARKTISRLQNENSDLTDDDQCKLKEIEATRQRLQISEARIADLENTNRDLTTLQREAEESISQLDVVVAERAKGYRELEERLRIAMNKIGDLEQINEEQKSAHQALLKEHEKVLLALSKLEGKLASQPTDALPHPHATDSHVAAEEVQVLRNTISSLQRENEEMKRQLESEISEKKTLATRAQYLEDLLESLSSQSSSSGPSEEKLRSLEAEVEKYVQEIQKLKKCLEEARQSPEAKVSELYPVYEIFELSPNFEAGTSGGLNSPQKSETLPSPHSPSEIKNSSSSEKPLRSEKSDRKISGAADSQRQSGGDSKPPSHSREELAKQNSNIQGDTTISSTRKYSTMNSSPSSSELSDYKAYRKKLSGEISALRKERQALKKDIFAWNAQFEKDNGREATREEKERLASDLYDRYQDVTSTLRKSEAKLERAEEKFKKVDRTQSISLSRQPSEVTPDIDTNPE